MSCAWEPQPIRMFGRTLKDMKRVERGIGVPSGKEISTQGHEGVRRSTEWQRGAQGQCRSMKGYKSMYKKVQRAV